MPDALALAQWCREALEAFKAPRHWWLWQGPWPLTASGKTDHGAIAGALLREGAERDASAPRYLRAWS
jgi:long-chain acyl-CoA synthetase